MANCSMACTKARVIRSTAVVDNTWAFLCWRMKRRAPSRICSRRTITFKYMRSMDSTCRRTCWLNTAAAVCGSFDFGSACGVPLRPGDRLTVVPLMEVISHLPSHARKRSRCLLGEPEQAEAKTKIAGRAPMCWSVRGKKGMQGKETAGVLSLPSRPLEHPHKTNDNPTCSSV